MKKVLILHGVKKGIFPHWQVWLESELKKQNFEVSFPSFKEHDLTRVKAIYEHMQKFEPDIVICHSVGVALWFHLVNTYKIKKIQKLMLVAPILSNSTEPNFKPFLPFSLPKDLRAKEAIIAFGDNDKFAPLEDALALQSALNIGMKVMPKAGHFECEDGFGELDCALEWVQR